MTVDFIIKRPMIVSGLDNQDEPPSKLSTIKSTSFSHGRTKLHGARRRSEPILHTAGYGFVDLSKRIIQ